MNKSMCNRRNCPPPGDLPSDREPVGWEPATSQDRFARPPHVLDWSCDCQPVTYEKVTAGGTFWIRRTIRRDPADPSAVEITESSFSSLEEVDTLWQLLMAGSIR